MAELSDVVEMKESAKMFLDAGIHECEQGRYGSARTLLEFAGGFFNISRDGLFLDITRSWYDTVLGKLTRAQTPDKLPDWYQQK